MSAIDIAPTEGKEEEEQSFVVAGYRRRRISVGDRWLLSSGPNMRQQEVVEKGVGNGEEAQEKVPVGQTAAGKVALWFQPGCELGIVQKRKPIVWQSGEFVTCGLGAKPP